MVTDRDIVVKCLAAGLDPATTTAVALAQGGACHVDATTTVEEMLLVMEDHRAAASYR